MHCFAIGAFMPCPPILRSQNLGIPWRTPLLSCPQFIRLRKIHRSVAREVRDFNRCLYTAVEIGTSLYIFDPVSFHPIVTKNVVPRFSLRIVSCRHGCAFRFPKAIAANAFRPCPSVAFDRTMRSCFCRRLDRSQCLVRQGLASLEIHYILMGDGGIASMSRIGCERLGGVCPRADRLARLGSC